MMLNRYSNAEWMRDGSEKHGEDLRAALCRTCSEQPELLMNKGFRLITPNWLIDVG
jgi:hypothetical protein